MPEKFLFLKGEPAEEADLRLFFPEACGLSAAINLPSASRLVYNCLIFQEKRGEKGVGILSYDEGIFHRERRKGKVRSHFIDFNFEKKLPGAVAVGHNRYATQGSAEARCNIQPLIFTETKYGPFSIAHNGTLVNTRKIKEDLISKGVIFQSSTDSELLAHLITLSNKEDIEEAIIDALHKVKAAYSLIIMTPDKLFAIKDKFGVRPLSVAKMNDGFLVCSENYVFDQFNDAYPLFDLQPGEMVIFENGLIRRRIYAEPDPHPCIFENKYFANKLTQHNGVRHKDFRQELGKEIAQENPELAADCIIPIPNSGCEAAIGLAEATGIPYKEYFTLLDQSWEEPGRSFTAPTPQSRLDAVRRKLHLSEDKIKDRHVLLVDDTIVRGTTMKIIIDWVRSAGAKQVDIVIPAPPIVDICPNGMDFQRKEDLVSYQSSIEDIRKLIGADRLIYLTLEGQQRVVDRTIKTPICNGCFGGRYPVIPEELIQLKFD